MNRKILSSAAIVCGLLFTGLVYSADAPALADRHVQMGLKCDACHGSQTPAPGAKVGNDKCLACHQSYEALAQKTEKLDPNPHYTHLGNVRCSDCHAGHQKPQLMCNDCHQFDLQPK